MGWNFIRKWRARKAATVANQLGTLAAERTVLTPVPDARQRNAQAVCGVCGERRAIATFNRYEARRRSPTGRILHASIWYCNDKATCTIDARMVAENLTGSTHPYSGDVITSEAELALVFDPNRSN